MNGCILLPTAQERPFCFRPDHAIAWLVRADVSYQEERELLAFTDAGARVAGERRVRSDC